MEQRTMLSKKKVVFWEKKKERNDRRETDIRLSWVTWMAIEKIG